MEGRKIYLQSVPTVLGAICDLIEIQKAKTTFSDTRHGKIHFQIKMYCFRWELRFAVADLGHSRTSVTLEILGEQRDRKNLTLREFALLDSMLAIGAEIELDEKEGCADNTG